ncbi:DinB family protein [Krasilnikovia sp. MM14-A1259]|uniref:DinB family protein n=1 Tax=Krasilnikovia sp. MM14-A1259 TaxID=3373539 RepID=UPI00381A6378
MIEPSSAVSDTASEPGLPIPETKDWTWVLDKPCGFCGFDSRDVAAADLAATIAGLAPQWREVLARDNVAERPEPGVWSALEYGCHVRDVFGVFAERAELILTDEDARFGDWDGDATARATRYWEQDPATVADELAVRCRRVAAVFAAAPEHAWGRRGLRSNGSVFTFESLGRYLLHDVVHHLADVSSPAPRPVG